MTTFNFKIYFQMYFTPKMFIQSFFLTMKNFLLVLLFIFAQSFLRTSIYVDERCSQISHINVIFFHKQSFTMKDVQASLKIPTYKDNVISQT
jgi:hypothetical protein